MARRQALLGDLGDGRASNAESDGDQEKRKEEQKEGARFRILDERQKPPAEEPRQRPGARTLWDGLQLLQSRERRLDHPSGVVVLG